MRTRCFFAFAAAAGALSLPSVSPAQSWSEPMSGRDAFEQLGTELPTPNVYRTASGAPGPRYWQQRADYVVEARLDDENQAMSGTQTVTYHNNSPDTLRYLWVQLDRNRFTHDADQRLTETTEELDRVPFRSLRRMLDREDFDGGFEIRSVTDAGGEPMDHTLVKTMMRIDLDEPLEPGDSVEFGIVWSFRINEESVINSRTAAEFFEDDGNYIYEMAHWFPRMAAYTDYAGWQNKQFLGRGEFTLEFGDYDVALTVPDDHVVAATGVLQNPEEVLTEAQRERLEAAADAEAPVFVITPEEAEANEASEPEGEKTWVFHAEDVRDFAFASSRKFIWDAMGHESDGRTVMAMSFYPNEGEPLWSKYSTHAIVHTMEVYSRYSFPYPYPVAISVNGPVGGMEYPMICFNGPRPEEDGTYSARTKYGLISVIIHEVGHFYFPMIVNSDERQWTWMDEGVNTFVQFLAEQEWEEDYPSRRGDPRNITPFMTSDRQVPIMSNSESLLRFGANAYAKPATALNILRETILGRELFDFAFKEYARRWKFKRPEPADLFRTMEDASGVDLDWFWRGWFFTTNHVDQAVTGVRLFTIDTEDPAIEKQRMRRERADEPTTLTERRNEGMERRVDRYPSLLDFYNDFDELDVTPKDRRTYEQLLERLDPEDADLLKLQMNFYVVHVENVGGVPMPVILKIDYQDGSTEELRIPAEVWRYNNKRVGKLVMTDKTIRRVEVDPNNEIADADERNNAFPPEIRESRFELYERKWDRPNPMQEARREKERAEKGEDQSGDGEGDGDEDS